MVQLYIDGQEGTTGLEIAQRLEGRDDIVRITIDPDKRKDPAARAACLNAADIAILCLPDAAAREAVAMIENPRTRVLDASTAHRTAPDWVYGFPELMPGQRQRIAKASRVANPGCYATGFISLVKPLRQAGILEAGDPVVCFATSGYSGGGKKMIAQYQAQDRDPALDGPRIYGLSQAHKHIPEMMLLCGLERRPFFSPIVTDIYRGMLVNVPLTQGRISLEALHTLYTAYYAGERFVSVLPLDSESLGLGGMLDPSPVAETNRLEIAVTGSGANLMVSARLDNLGKGASGAAVQNLNLMMGAAEDAFLR